MAQEQNLFTRDHRVTSFTTCLFITFVGLKKTKVIHPPVHELNVEVIEKEEEGEGEIMLHFVTIFLSSKELGDSRSFSDFKLLDSLCFLTDWSDLIHLCGEMISLPRPWVTYTEYKCTYDFSSRPPLSTSNRQEWKCRKKKKRTN